VGDAVDALHHAGAEPGHGRRRRARRAVAAPLLAHVRRELLHVELRWGGDPDGSQLPTYAWSAQQAASAFVAGRYAITYGQARRQLAFDVSSPLTAQQHLVAGGAWWERLDANRLQLHWTWTLVGPGGVAPDTSGVDLSRLVKLCIVTVRFSDGTSVHKDTPDPGQTSFVPDIHGHTVDQVTDFAFASRDLFGNEYSVSYQR